MGPDALIVVVRAVLYVDLLAMFGLAIFGLGGLPSAAHAVSMLPLRSSIPVMALLGLAVSIVQIVAMAASMAGIPVAKVSAEIIDQLVNGTIVGTAWKVRMAALLALVPTALVVTQRPVLGLALVSGLAGVSLATLAWAGHGAMDSGAIGWLHLGGDIVHLLAAGVWIGAIGALCKLLFDGHARVDVGHLGTLYRALENFATTGTTAVGLILLTGILNAWIIMGPQNLLALPSHAYGRLLLFKVVLFLAMLGWQQ